MIIGDSVTIGGGGQTASILATGALTSTDSCYATKGGKTYNGVWYTEQVINPAWRGLPSGYTQVEYLQNTYMAYIIANISCSENLKTEVDFMYDEYQANNGPVMFGAPYNSTQSYNYYYQYWNSQQYYVYNTGNIYSPLAVGTRHRIIFNDNKKFYLDDTLLFTSSSSMYSTNTMYIFTIPLSGGTLTNSDFYFRGKIYSLKFSLNGTILRDFIPCLNTSTGKYGLYDLVSNTFFGNSGTGDFAGGEAVPQYLTTQGFLIDKLKEYGTYTVTATQGSSTETVNVLIDSAERFIIQITFS